MKPEIYYYQLNQPDVPFRFSLQDKEDPNFQLDRSKYKNPVDKTKINKSRREFLGNMVYVGGAIMAGGGLRTIYHAIRNSYDTDKLSESEKSISAQLAKQSETLYSNVCENPSEVVSPDIQKSCNDMKITFEQEEVLKEQRDEIRHEYDINLGSSDGMIVSGVVIAVAGFVGKHLIKNPEEKTTKD
jgi:hypothetical protein